MTEKQRHSEGHCSVISAEHWGGGRGGAVTCRTANVNEDDGEGFLHFIQQFTGNQRCTISSFFFNRVGCLHWNLNVTYGHDLTSLKVKVRKLD